MPKSLTSKQKFSSQNFLSIGLLTFQGLECLTMDISERIKQQMQALGLKAVNIVKLTGVSKGTVSQWVNGVSTPSGQNLIALSNALQCSPEWILTGKDESYSKLNSDSSGYTEILGGFDLWDNDTPLDDDEVAIPFFREVELSAGDGSTMVKENNGAKLRFAKSTLKKCGVSAESAACVMVSGNSMEPVLPNGSTVGIDKSQTQIIDGKMYAVDHNGMLRVKLLYRTPQGLRLRSYNQDEFPDESLVFGKDSIRVIGRVFWSSVLY